ncbi:MAG: hypothetical protein QM604_00980 [Microbacterium sp.]
MKRTRTAIIAAAAAALLGLTSCSAGATETSETSDSGLPAAEAGSALDLSDVCPATVVLQQDWEPEAEHGAMYALVGSDYTIDEEGNTVTGSLVAQGVDTGVDVQVRPGGPTYSYQSVSTLMYLDDSITLGAVNTDQAISSYADQPTIAVTSQLTYSPQILMWDPDTYPDATTIADVIAEGATVLTSGDIVPALLEETVGLDPAKSDTSYDSTSARFVADPSLLQQGFATAEPYIYENEIAEWDKPVDYQLLSDIGYNIYPEPLAVRADKLEELTPCLEKLVPIMQQSQIDYLNDPTETNELIVELAEAYDTGWVYSEGVADYSAQTQVSDGLAVDDPASGVFGQFDPDRMQEIVDTFVPLLEAQGTLPEGTEIDPEDLYTNEFIDTSISID